MMPSANAKSSQRDSASSVVKKRFRTVNAFYTGAHRSSLPGSVAIHAVIDDCDSDS